MPYRGSCLKCATRALVAALISVLVCTAASAGGFYPRGRALYANPVVTPGYAVPGYGYRPTWSPGPLENGAGGEVGGNPVWRSWQQGPVGFGSSAGHKIYDGGATWGPPQQTRAPSGNVVGGAGDSSQPVGHPKRRRITHVRVVPPTVIVSPIRPQLPLQSVADQPPVPPTPVIAPPAVHELPPTGKSSTTHNVAPRPSLTPTPSLTPAPARSDSTYLGALAALAAALPLARLLVKGLRRRWRRNPARVVLVSDQGRTRMIATGAAPVEPIVELRLLTSTPVSTLRLAA